MSVDRSRLVVARPLHLALSQGTLGALGVSCLSCILYSCRQVSGTRASSLSWPDGRRSSLVCVCAASIFLDGDHSSRFWELPPQEFNLPIAASLERSLVSVVNHNSSGLKISLMCPSPAGVQTIFFHLRICLSACFRREKSEANQETSS